MTGGGLCEVCQAEAHQACGGCANVFYCGKEHQRKHWPDHRQHCQPYRLVSSPDAGQYLVAGRQLKAGQRVLRDTPLIVAPLATSSLLCLGCSAAIVSDDFVKCSQCEWPLCSPECATSKFHKEECPILARDSTKIGPPKELEETPHYDIIMVIRCLLLRSADPSSWKVLLSMASHVEQRMAAEEWHHTSTVYYLTQVLNVDYDADTVHQVRSAIATNAMEIMSEKGTRLRALYPRIRLLNHSCIPNTHLTSESDGVMEVRTAISVNSGEPLHICYTGTTMPLWERQTSLHDSYYFTCACSRCEDPTELGTYFSSPRCPECKGFYLEPSKKLEEIMWVCQNCKIEQSNSVMQEKIDEWLCKIETHDLFEGSSAKEVKAVLDNAEKTFHSCHYIWMKVAQLTLWKMRDNNPTMETLKLRRDIWIRLLELYSTFEPGLTRRRGMSLMEAGTAIFNASVREYKENSESFLPQCISQIEPVVKYFQEASYILGLDAPESHANAIAKRAEKKRREAEEFLARMNSGNLRADDSSDRPRTMGVLQICEMCGANDTSVSCGECEQVFYCSSSHREDHWEQHKDTCQPTVIEQKDPKLGRFLVVAHDVKAGELLFKEEPIALGPRATSPPICLGCYKLISDLDSPRCPKCRWFLCSLACASTELHKAECPTLAVDTENIGQPIDLSVTPRYDIILVLRCLLLRDTNPKDWYRLLDMASHADRMTDMLDPYHMGTTRYIREVLKAKFDSKFIHHARGAIMANCFEWCPIDVDLRGVYPKTGRLNHSCHPNVALSVDCDGVMYVRAAVDVKYLSPLYITYTGTTTPIWEREAYINKMHYFSCGCTRCADPTELGLHYSSPKCESCTLQYLEPKTWLGETKWECPKCHKSQSDNIVKTEYFQWISRFDCSDTFIRTTPRSVKNLLEKVEFAFHSTHHVWVMAAQVAIRTLKDNDSRDSLVLRCDLWRKLLKIYSVVEPGMTLLRGMAFYELGICQASLARVEMREGLLTDYFFNVYMKQALEHLQEAAAILRLEPPNCDDHQWYKKAIVEAENVTLDIKPDLEKNGITPMVILDNADPLDKTQLEIEIEISKLRLRSKDVSKAVIY